METTVGHEKVSVTITRKTQDDVLISTHSSERWFATEVEATKCLYQILDAFIEEPGNHTIQIIRNETEPSQATDDPRGAQIQ